MLIQGSPLEKPIIMSDWQENHQIMMSLSEEGAASQEDLTSRDFLDISMFWGPEWLEYKAKGGSLDSLTQKKANQRARLYLARGDSQPILVFEGKAPRYVGSEGVRVLAQHGVSLLTTTEETRANSDNSKWFYIAVTSILLCAVMSLFAIRMKLFPVSQKEPPPAVITNVAGQR
jgi:hypothetical protein